jgi:hypothetical protein
MTKLPNGIRTIENQHLCTAHTPKGSMRPPFIVENPKPPPALAEYAVRAYKLSENADGSALAQDAPRGQAKSLLLRRN